MIGKDSESSPEGLSPIFTTSTVVKKVANKEVIKPIAKSTTPKVRKVSTPKAKPVVKKAVTKKPVVPKRPTVKKVVPKTAPTIKSPIVKKATPVKKTVAKKPVVAKPTTAKKAPVKPRTARKTTATGRPDNLKRIEGIGVKIEQLLKADGIDTFAKLSRSSVTRLRGILDKAGPRFRMHKPTTWGEQAAIAAKGDWAALKVLQDELKGGLRK